MIALTDEIKDMTIPWLFLGLNAEKKTGTVVFTQDAVVKKVYFTAGDIIFASSNVSEDWLGEWLVRAGTITRQQCDASKELVRQTGKRQGEILIELGFITPEGLEDGLKFQVKQIIISLFNWRDGSYLVDESPLPVSDIIPLRMSTGNLIIEGLRGLEWQVVRKSLSSLKTVLRPVADPSFLFQGADLTQDQGAVLSLIDGAKSIEEVCSRSGIGDFNTLKAIYVLRALRMVETGEIKTEEEKKFVREVVQETIAAKEKRTAEPKVARTITKEGLLAAYEGLESQNHYEVLGVGRTATPQEIKKAYFSFAMLYHPDRHFTPEMSDMKGKLETLFTAIHDAYETLTDQVKRDEYDLQLVSGVQKREAAVKKPDDRESAAIQFNEGMKQSAAGNFWGADEAFRWAVRLDPDNAEYVFRRGLNLSHMPRRGHDAEEYFAKAVKMAPKKMEYYLAFGTFYEKNGLKAKALSVYHDALKHDPQAEKINQAINKINT